MDSVKKTVYITKEQDALIRHAVKHSEKGMTYSGMLKCILDDFFRIELKYDKDGKAIVPEFLKKYL